MSRCLNAAALLLVLGTTAIAQVKQQGAMGLSAADEKAIRAIIADYAPTAKNKQWDKMMGFYASDAIRLPPNEPLVTHAKLRAWFDAYPTITQFECPLLSIEAAGDVAAVRGTYNVTVTVPGQGSVQDHGKYISIMRKQAGGGWKIVEDIWNSDVPVKQ